MVVVYQLLLVFGVVVLFSNLKNKITNYREKGQVLYVLKMDNRMMNMLSGVVIAMIILMGYALYANISSGGEVQEIEIIQFAATVVLFGAVSINSLSKTVITETGIIKNNILIRWENIRKIEWTGFNKSTCTAVIDFTHKNKVTTVRLKVKEDREEKDKVTSLIKQYRKSSKKKK